VAIISEDIENLLTGNPIGENQGPSAVTKTGE
jgi:hypothetical protein